MTAFLITYDLLPLGRNYAPLISAIKQISDGLYWKELESTWIIITNIGAIEIRDLLIPYIDNNDKLLIVSLDYEAAWSGLSKESEKWLKENLR